MTTASASVMGSGRSIRSFPNERRRGETSRSGGCPLGCHLGHGVAPAELAAIEGADIMAGAKLAQEAALGVLLKALLDQLPDHGNKDRVGPDRGNADHVHVQLVRPVLGLEVEIEEHFEMVRDEPDRDYDHVFGARLVQSVQLVQNVGLEPGDVRWTAAALPGKPVAPGAG